MVRRWVPERARVRGRGRHWTPRGALLTASAGLAACASGCSAEEAPANAPPLLELVAEDTTLGQGQSRSFEVLVSDPEGDPATVVLTSSDPGLEVVLDQAQQHLDVHASYAVVGPVTVDARLTDERGAEQLQHITVTVAPITWQGTTTWTDADGPQAREHGATLVDPEGGFALLVGGSGYSPYLQALDDVWRYDLATSQWSAVTATGEVPGPAGSRRAAQIPGTNVAYLFGGYATGGSPALAELWELDFAGGGAAFRSVAQQNAPAPRSLHGFVYDPVSERFLLFGGVGSEIFDDTWVMRLEGDTAVWTELLLEPRPSARYGFFYGFDAANGRLVLFSGAQGTSSVDPANDTWVLDVRSDPPTWQLVADESASPPGRRNGCMVLDPSGPRLWIYGGTPDAATSAPGLWVLDARPSNERWEELSLDGAPPVRSSGFGLYDAAGDRTLLGFGNTALSRFQDWSSLGY